LRGRQRKRDRDGERENVLTSVDSGAALRLLAFKCLYDFEVDLDPAGTLCVPAG